MLLLLQLKQLLSSDGTPAITNTNSGTGTTKSQSGKTVAELDNEMKLVAKHHLESEGSSIKALEKLEMAFFLPYNQDDNRYQQSAKLRGVPCLEK